jgi:hypothetical protein
VTNIVPLAVGGPLAHVDHAAGTHRRVVRQVAQLLRGEQTHPVEARPQQRDGVAPQRQPGGGVVEDDVLALGAGARCSGASFTGASFSSGGARREAAAAQACWRRWPARLERASAAARAFMSLKSSAARSARSSTLVKGASWRADTHAGRALAGQTAHHAQAEADLGLQGRALAEGRAECWIPACAAARTPALFDGGGRNSSGDSSGALQRAVDVAQRHVHRQHLDAMAHRVWINCEGV